MSRQMPTLLGEAIRRASEGVGHRGLADRASRISEQYRAAAPSKGMIVSGEDALAYGLSRMPATYAAVAKVLGELCARAPHFAPASLLDAGAGPGTASWAAVETWPELESATLLDHSSQFLALAQTLAADASPVLAGAERILSDISRFDLAGRRFDLVTCAYALTELGDTAMVNAAEQLWAHCGGVLAIVEPGRPRDYQRLLAVRTRLLEQGASVLAPCPHAAPCPLVAPDWCHFSVRLARSRDHMRMKGGTLGYEDEKFSYLIVAREGIGEVAQARVVRPPFENKFSVSLDLCTPKGLERRVVSSRDRTGFKAARKLTWGDST